jgi:hypothetical protein
MCSLPIRYGVSGLIIQKNGSDLVIRNSTDTADVLRATNSLDVTIYRNLTVNGQATVGRHDAGDSGAAITLDWNNGNNQKVRLTGNVTLGAFSNPIAGTCYVIEFLQDATGGRTVTWPANVKWSGGTTPAITTTAGVSTIVSLYYNGTNYAAGLFVDNVTI